MKPRSPESAAIAQPTPHTLELSGLWTALELGQIARRVGSLRVPDAKTASVDATGVLALDTAGAHVLQQLLLRLRNAGMTVTLHGLRPSLLPALELVAAQIASEGRRPVPSELVPGPLEKLGRSTWTSLNQSAALLAFIGEIVIALAGCLVHPLRIRWRPILYNIRSAGFDALPIVGLLSFLLGVVVAYQGAAQLRQYGASIFVADLVGLSMLREFAPLMTAIIIAGRSGSAYAAQIGTMKVTEEIDALRTLGIPPLELLVLPKIVALLIVLPLLTVFADILGVAGGMMMARVQLGIGFSEFLERFIAAISIATVLTGIGKAPVFALIIAVTGCFQGFLTRGGAEGVGRQTTRSVVQSIFLVIVADALFSIAFSALDL